MLISGETGQESEGHDWNNLLRIWGALGRDTRDPLHRCVVWQCSLCVVSIVVGLAAAAGWRGKPSHTTDCP